MHTHRITQFRAEAAACVVRANADCDKITAAHWLRMAADWTRMADDLEDMSGATPREPNYPS